MITNNASGMVYLRGCFPSGLAPPKWHLRDEFCRLRRSMLIAGGPYHPFLIFVPRAKRLSPKIRRPAEGAGLDRTGQFRHDNV